jgi:hypothetical protein
MIQLKRLGHVLLKVADVSESPPAPQLAPGGLVLQSCVYLAPLVATAPPECSDWPETRDRCLPPG